MSEQAAIDDFRARVAQYEATYETIDDAAVDGAEAHRSWIKITDCRRFVINNIRGYLPSRIVQFLSHLHMQPHSFYFSRHGQSEYNVLGKIGGDSGLTAYGDAYAGLAGFCARDHRDPETGDERPRASGRRPCAARGRRPSHRPQDDDHRLRGQRRQPRAGVGPAPAIAWSNLDEMAGVCDMTYAEIERHYPDEFKRRQDDKLAYRYPRGESYLDMIHRLDTMVHEMERHREPLLIIAHQGILRLLYAYLMGLPREEAPYVSIPLNTVIKLEPKTYTCEEARFQLLSKPKTDDGQTEPAVTRDDDPPSH